MDPAGTAWNYLAASDFPRDITLLATITKVVFEDDTLADIAQGVYNHHLTFADMNKLPPVIVSCNRNATKAPDAYPISTFMGGSNDKGGALYTTADGKLNSGYYIGKDDKILILGDLVNYKNVAQDVYTLSEIEYVEGRGSNVMEASVQVLDVGFCEGASGIIEPPKGQTKFQVIGKEMTITKDGYWLTSKGHLHGKFSNS
jgi:hypothetical protein